MERMQTQREEEFRGLENKPVDVCVPLVIGAMPADPSKPRSGFLTKTPEHIQTPGNQNSPPHVPGNQITHWDCVSHRNCLLEVPTPEA